MTKEQEQQILAVREEILSYTRKIYEIAKCCSKSGYLNISIAKDWISFNNDYYKEENCIIPINYSESLRKKVKIRRNKLLMKDNLQLKRSMNIAREKLIKAMEINE